MLSRDSEALYEASGRILKEPANTVIRHTVSDRNSNKKKTNIQYKGAFFLFIYRSGLDLIL